MAGKNKINPQGLPDTLIEMLSAEDRRNGHAPGTMFALLQQETGGSSKFLDDPTTYHYGLNAEGKRVAPHTGKVSTAFGPFGILESTAKNPGYGVAPLKDKSLAEQARFASDYFAARGAANYGEGAKYAAQLQARIPGAPVVQALAPVADPRTVSTAPVEVPVAQVAQATEQAQVPSPTQAPVQQQAVASVNVADPWQEYLAATRQGQAVAEVPIAQQGTSVPGFHVPDFMSGITLAKQTPSIQLLRAMKGWA